MLEEKNCPAREPGGVETGHLKQQFDCLNLITSPLRCQQPNHDRLEFYRDVLKHVEWIAENHPLEIVRENYRKVTMDCRRRIADLQRIPEAT